MKDDRIFQAIAQYIERRDQLDIGLYAEIDLPVVLGESRGFGHHRLRVFLVVVERLHETGDRHRRRSLFLTRLLLAASM